eukprot:gnl/MRDRNA2_/MRDRNA2_86593_c0_seq8.p1 gnl/MRDRNA2_/MRDRNA2_86593_c0~~gnl/MRDRNA2_/MRDRNA2_86593_c0_seq8.p1  ORF type:complete len:555 (+),score=105.89 gnl/MRDRNA2_/MRDRNA2_86593_c0_seq8:167-1666(+)
MTDTTCLNVASQPLMNTQFAQLGALDALNDAGLLDKVTGYSGVSSGAFVMALAATPNLTMNSRKFREVWPGWSNMVPMSAGGKMSDPLLSEHYHKRVLSQVLPETFEELKIPLAVVAVAYDNEKAAAMIDENKAQPMVVSDGNLPKAVITSSSAMMGPGCPRCMSGFQAKDFRGHWPVADGFLKDEYGTLGLAALEPCGNLLHFQPQNFAQQLTPTKNSDLDTQPTNVVSLGLDIPSSGIMSMLWDSMLKPINRVRMATLQGKMPLGGMANQDEIWEKLQYETAYDHMTEMLDQPMQVHEKPIDDEKHYFVDLNLKKHWDNIRGWGERKWDQKFDTQHAEYWDKTIPRRNKMVGERNAMLANGTLSYRACGNGLGAPRCNRQGEKIARYGFRSSKPSLRSVMEKLMPENPLAPIAPLPRAAPRAAPMPRASKGFGKGKGLMTKGFGKGKGKLKAKQLAQARADSMPTQEAGTNLVNPAKALNGIFSNIAPKSKGPHVMR